MATATSTSAANSTVSWVEGIVSKLKPAISGIAVTVAGVNVTSSVALSLVTWLLSNRANLEFVGREAFHDFLDLFDQGKKEAAFQALLAGMDANAIIAQMNMDAAQLKADNDNRDQFIKNCEGLLLNIAEGLGPKILLAVIL